MVTVSTSLVKNVAVSTETVAGSVAKLQVNLVEPEHANIGTHPVLPLLSLAKTRS